MQKIISFFTLAIGALSSLYAQAPGIQWQKTIGGNFDDFPSELLQTADGGYILGGQSNSSISGDKAQNSLGFYDYWVVKLAPESVPTEEAPNAHAGVTIYPNPASDAIFVRSEGPITLCLRNALGEVLSTQTIQNQSKIDLSRYANGIYFLLEMESGIGHKIIIDK